MSRVLHLEKSGFFGLGPALEDQTPGICEGPSSILHIPGLRFATRPWNRVFGLRRRLIPSLTLSVFENDKSLPASLPVEAVYFVLDPIDLEQCHVVLQISLPTSSTEFCHT